MLGNNLNIWFKHYILQRNSEEYLNLLTENNECITAEDLRCLYIDLILNSLIELNLLTENDIELTNENYNFIEVTGYLFLLSRSGDFLYTRDNKNILINN